MYQRIDVFVLITSATSAVLKFVKTLLSHRRKLYQITTGLDLVFYSASGTFLATSFRISERLSALASFYIKIELLKEVQEFRLKRSPCLKNTSVVDCFRWALPVKVGGSWTRLMTKRIGLL